MSKFLDAIGNTPLIRLDSLSEATGCNILAKCEHLNPGGSVKDRTAKFIVDDLEASKQLVPGGTIVEGTGGNTGIGLALIAGARGYKLVLTMPCNIATEKIELMKLLGAEVVLTPIVPFRDEQHYVHTAVRLAKERPNAVFANQFDNLSNCKAHYKSTGPEIWRQSKKKVDGFICSSGTGGTLSGISQFLKERNSKIQCYLIDPLGSGLFEFVNTKGTTNVTQGNSPTNDNVRYLKVSEGNSITEGIGIARVTENMATAVLDGAVQGTDREVIEMAYYLIRNEGLLVGPSAALNVVGAIKLARKLGPGHTIVTILCDTGERYRSKMYSEAWLTEKNLHPLSTGTDISFVEPGPDDHKASPGASKKKNRLSFLRRVGSSDEKNKLSQQANPSFQLA